MKTQSLLFFLTYATVCFYKSIKKYNTQHRIYLKSQPFGFYSHLMIAVSLAAMSPPRPNPITVDNRIQLKAHELFCTAAWFNKCTRTHARTRTVSLNFNNNVEYTYFREEKSREEMQRTQD